MFWRRRTSQDEDLVGELRSHLELEIEEQREEGAAPEEARHAARRAFGNTTLVKKQVREMGRWLVIHNFRQDVAYAARTLLRDRAFAVATLLMLSLGIGATTANFTVVYGVLLKPLDYPDSARIVLLSGGATLVHFEELRKTVAPSQMLERSR